MRESEPRPAPAAPAITPPPESIVAPVVRLRPIRTLVIARDLAFRQRATTVLVELGHVAFAVISLDSSADVVALAAQQRADVLVLDATGCAHAIGRVTSALHDASPRIGIVVVTDEMERPAHGLPALAKWGWAADLSRAVADAYRHGNPLNEERSDVRS